MRLSTHPATTGMISTIHVLKARAFEDDETYRDFLRKEAGVDSAKQLTVRTAGRVIDRLRELAGEAPAVRGAVGGLNSAIGGKLRALWIAGYDLGVVTDRTDRAMLSYLQRQTGVSHTHFLSNPAAASSAIEGLKGWLARAAAVEWPSDRDDVVASKMAVIQAQLRRLEQAGEFDLTSFPAYISKVTRNPIGAPVDGPELDNVQRALGRQLRGLLAKRAGAPS